MDTASVEQAQEIGNDGALKITLLWDFKADIDLHVIEPSGEEISFTNTTSSTSDGFLDVDNITGEGNPAADNIFWENPPEGTYVVSLHYYAKKTFFARRGDCTVVVLREGHDPETRHVRMKKVDQTEHVITFTL